MGTLASQRRRAGMIGADTALPDRLFAAAIVFGTAVTLLLGLSRDANGHSEFGHAVLPALDLILDTVSLVIFVALTALAWSRAREAGVLGAAYHASAFLVLAVAYGIGLWESLQHSGSMDNLADPEQVQALVFTLGRLGAAALFVLAGTFVSRPTFGLIPRSVLLGPTLALVVVTLVASGFTPPDALQILEFNVHPHGLPNSTPFGAALHVTIAVLFFAGAYASRRMWRTGQAVIDGWIAIGLLLAGFGELQWTLFPSAHPGQVATGDLFQLGFALALLVGLESAVRVALREVRAANVELAELRDAELERASLEERTRVARELHDGLAQDLWLAKLRMGELIAIPDLPGPARAVAVEAATAVDVGLGGAREAVAALRRLPDGWVSFADVVRQTAEEYGDRYGMRVEVTCEGEAYHRIAPRTQAEILRIIQEALTNAARHASATVVGVRLTFTHDRISLRIADNGRGFDPSAVGPGSFGLLSMRERAALIGGRLRIASSIGVGTRIMLSAPFVRPGLKPGAET